MPVLEYRDLLQDMEGLDKKPSEIPASIEKERNKAAKDEDSTEILEEVDTDEGNEPGDECTRENEPAEAHLRKNTQVRQKAPGEGSEDSKWKIQTDTEEADCDEKEATGEINSEENADEEESHRLTLVKRVRSQPVLLVPIGGIAIAVWMFASSVMGGSAPAENVSASSEKTLEGYPQLEPPKVREEPYTHNEVVRMVNEAGMEASKKARPGLLNLPRTPQDVEKIQSVKKRLESVRSKRKKKSRSAKRRKRKRAGKHTQNPVLIDAAVSAEVAAAPKRPRRPRGAGFYKAGVTISSSGGKKKDGKTVIPPGTSFLARLKVGVSTDFAGATVLAEVLEPVGDGKSVLLSKGSIIKGRMRGAGDRIYIDFRRAVTNGKKMTLKGYAVTGKLPGIPARVKGGPGSENTSRTGSVLSRGSMRTAQGVVGTLGGGSVTGQLVRNVAGESLNEVRQDVNDRPGRTLELPSGVEFTVVITG